MLDHAFAPDRVEARVREVEGADVTNGVPDSAAIVALPGRGNQRPGQINPRHLAPRARQARKLTSLFTEAAARVQHARAVTDTDRGTSRPPYMLDSRQRGQPLENSGHHPHDLSGILIYPGESRVWRYFSQRHRSCCLVVNLAGRA
ncbi:MAG TPA: hypothetical protein VF070_29280 [Streptosporangiaceae bacterium]